MSYFLVTITEDLNHSDKNGVHRKKQSVEILDRQDLLPSGVMIKLNSEHSAILSKEFIDFYSAKLKKK